jgi:aspartyl-tRNA(Asn)/glutamyl-tRNA(Gln) amidotransferase subunit A
MARSAQDIAWMFAVMAGYDKQDARSIRRAPSNPLATIDDGVRGVRIGIAEEFFFDGVEPEIDQHVREAAKTFEELGAVITSVTIPRADQASDIANPIIWAEAFAVHQERYLEQSRSFGDDTRLRLGLGERVTGSDFATAFQKMLEWRRELNDVFKLVDILLSPSAAAGAPRIDDAETVSTTAELVRLHHHWSLAYLPALSIPCGLTRDGLPIGVQLAARPWQEPVLLRAAAAYQRVTDWHRRRAALLAI